MKNFVFLLLYIQVGSLYAFCIKNNGINEIEKKRFLRVPWNKIYNLSLKKYQSIKYTVIKEKNKFQIVFYIKCTGHKYKTKFTQPSQFNSDMKLLLNIRFKNSNELDIIKAKNLLQNFLQKKGYLNNKINIIKNKISNLIIYFVKVSLGIKYRYVKIDIIGNLPKRLIIDVNKKFKNVVSSQENTQKIISFVNDYLYKSKYKFYKISSKIYTHNNKKKLILIIKNLSKLYIYVSLDKKIINIQHFKNQLYNKIQTIRDLQVLKLSKKVDDYFKNMGWFNVKIKVKKLISNKENISYRYLYLSISQGQKKKINLLSFINSRGLSHELKELYFKFASDKASAGYWDKLYINEFKSRILNFLYAKGYSYATVDKPEILIKKNKVNISYKLNLKKRVKISSIKILDKKGVFTPNDVDLFNKVGLFLNITKVKEDQNILVNYYKSLGYIFAKIYKTEHKVISYFDNKVEILFPISIGKIARVNNVRLYGKLKTKKYVIWREIDIKKNDLLTSVSIQKLRNSLLSLGLFSTVKINLVPTSDLKFIKTNLEIHLVEKNFSSAEIKPGFRTDLGFKLGTKLSFNNAWYKHHKISLQFNSNKRISQVGLETSRLKKRDNFIEFDTHFIYSVPYFISNINLTNSLSRQKHMFYSFDAFITKLRESVSKRLSKHFEVYSTYQFENIDQSFGTLEIDNDTFKIGSLSLGFISDFRDRNIFPRNGFWSNFSYEFTHPNLGALKNNNGEINFFRIISQNKFYKSFKNNVFAMSANLGFAQNLAQEKITLPNGNLQSNGYIPSIKIFRLSGIESVRGYLEDEINKIGNKDISEYRINNKIMYLSAKIEFRIPVSENLYWGPFYDFGNVFINKFSIKGLRQAAGLVFKFLTPVGTIDFSYGIKLKRVHKIGAEETFGEFNLKIGSY